LFSGFFGCGAFVYGVDFFCDAFAALLCGGDLGVSSLCV
jgi:hypothetical protein